LVGVGAGRFKEQANLFTRCPRERTVRGHAHVANHTAQLDDALTHKLGEK
jgi:hypothetical protein